MPPKRQRGRGRGAGRGRGGRPSSRRRSSSSHALASASGPVIKGMALNDTGKELILGLMSELELARRQEAAAEVARNRTEKKIRSKEVAFGVAEGGVAGDGDDRDDDDIDDEGDDDEEKEEDSGDEGDRGFAGRKVDAVEVNLEELVIESSSSGDDAQALGKGFEYDSVFRDMANMMAGVALDSDGESGGSDDESDSDDSSGDGEGGAGASAQKPLTKQEQKQLLKALIVQEKEHLAVQEAHEAEEVEARRGQLGKSRKKEAGAQSSKEKVKGAKGKVRATICSERGNKRKIVLIDRKKDLAGLFKVAKDKLQIKKAKAAFLASSGELLENTLSLRDDDVIVITDKEVIAEEAAAGGGGGGAGHAARGEARHDERNAAHGHREESPTPARPKQDEESVWLAAVREAYRKRAAERMDKVPRLSEVEVAEEGARLQDAASSRQSSREFQAMLKQRQGLPAWSRRGEIVKCIEDSQVVVVEGATGSGKTTQVPQFILDSWVDAGRGAECNIVCTQPRRISAIGVAERVAAERTESIGETVGYQIRLDQRRSRRTRLLFCTTGILLRRLTSDPELEGVTHVIADEVHERDLHTDFLLIILKDLLARRPSLKVVLMSATLEASLFSNYFGGCPCLHIPGRTFPVTEYFLPDVYETVSGRSVGRRVEVGAQRRGGRGRGRERGARGGRGGGQGRDYGRRGSYGGDGDDEDDGSEAVGRQGDAVLQELFGDPNTKTKALVSPPSDKTPIDYDLILLLVQHILENSTTLPAPRARPQSSSSPKYAHGAILIFLPGFAEIDRMVGMMRRDPLTGDGNRVKLFPLHSSIPTEAQRSVFRRMPEGVTKVVIATNIAETSITIDDVVHVIDAGRVKEMGYDPHTHMSSLREVWVSRASAAQRAGRAGRTQPGTCWRMYDKDFMLETMLQHTLPEMRRTSLEDLVLTVLLLELGPPDVFLKKAVQPPSPRAITAALRTLVEIEAVMRLRDGSFQLKPLGYHLAALPVDARLGKMLIVASIFDVLEPVLTIAAALSYKTPFCTPFQKLEQAWLAKQRFADAMSDHLAIVDAYKAWQRVRKMSYAERKQFCMDNFLSMSTLETIEGMREQYRSSLAELGFTASEAPRADATPDYTANQHDISLVKCVLCSGLSPQVARLVRPVRGKGAHFVTRDGSEVAIHPSSANAKRVRDAGPGRTALVVYHKKVETSRVYLHDITFCTPLSLMLFGANVKLSRESGSRRKIDVIVDDWLSFKMNEESSFLLKALKREIDRVLLLKVAEPATDLVRTFSPVVSTIRKLLRAELDG